MMNLMTMINPNFVQVKFEASNLFYFLQRGIDLSGGVKKIHKETGPKRTGLRTYKNTNWPNQQINYITRPLSLIH
jgi:ribosomal protein S16